MERDLVLKRRAYLGLASAPALLSALSVFVFIATMLAAPIYFLARLSFTETVITAAAGCIAAFLAHAVQLLGSPKVACVLGVDGIEVRGFDTRVFGRFVPWSEVRSIHRAGGAVHFHLRDDRTLSVRAWTRPLYLDASNLLRAFRKRERIDGSDGYRELETDPRTLVRVAEDPRQDRARRLAAFSKLDEAQRTEVLDALADPATREALAGE